MDNRQNSTINWYPGHMAKAKREIKEKLNLIDIVYEVIDSRMPLSSKIADIDEFIVGKPKILIMTKYDLCDKEETDKFILYYKELGYSVIPVDLMQEKNISIILEESNKLLKTLNDKRKAIGMKARSARVLIIGAPNVGKSTLINRLVGKKAAGVGDKPGFTKGLSWIRIHKDIELLDTPGILWPKLENQEQAKILASFSSIKDEIFNQDEIAWFILQKMNELYKENLKMRYGIEELSDDIIEAYEVIAKRRGAITKGGIADYEKVSQIIIKDLRNGSLGKITFDRLDEKFN